MSISFNCVRCKKKVKAPDTAGGQYGTCPHCKYKCFIPMPHDDSEPELKLADIDEEEERKYSNMMRETHHLSQNILHETAGDEAVDSSGEPMSERELIKNIVVYLRMIADGQLDQAERLAAKIRGNASAAKGILKRMARTERPEPELEGIPPRILLRLMKDLSSSL